ncbi:MAG: hypothetical protein IJZ91_00720 [Oscillospiraceae bacterium]|nr:hypothetical protein [Oscillospiraceae bacterium]
MSDTSRAQAASAAASSHYMVTRSVTAEPDVCMIVIDMRNLYDERATMTQAIGYCCEVAPEIFSVTDSPQIYLQFYERSGDKELMTITMRLTRDTSTAMDWEYWSLYKYSQQQAFFDSLDGYSLHRDYKNALK